MDARSDKPAKGRRAKASPHTIIAVPPSLLRSSLFLMIQLLREAARVRDLRFPDTQLRFPHRGVLACLQESGGLAQREISERLRTDASDLVKILDDLEGWGMVRRRLDPADRRRRIVELTASGRRAAAEHDRVVEEANAILLEPLGKAERKAFHVTLERLRQHLVGVVESERPARGKGRAGERQKKPARDQR